MTGHVLAPSNLHFIDSTLVPREPHGFSAADAFVTYKLKSPRGLADTWPSWSWKKEDSRKILALFERGLITGPTPYGSPRTHKPQQALLLRYFLSILALGSITQPNTFFRFRRDGLGLLLPGFRPPDGNVLEIPGLLEDRRSTVAFWNPKLMGRPIGYQAKEH